MPSRRPFPDGEQSVTVHLVDGSTRVGKIRSFNPANEVVLAVTPGPGEKDNRRSTLVLGPERIAYVALHRSETPLPPASVELRTWTVHVVGERTLTVKAEGPNLNEPLGFIGWPEADVGLYAAYWFFSHAVRRVELQEHLGAMLLGDGILVEEELEAGLERQAEERSVRLGDILVEADLVPLEAVQRAAEQQALQQVSRRPQRLGEILVESGMVSTWDIARALEMQEKRRGKRLGQILVEMGMVREHQISEILARKFSMPYVDLDIVGVDPTALSQVPFEIIERYAVLPIHSDSTTLTIALADPLALEGIDMLRFHVRKQVREVVVTPSQLARHLDPLLNQSRPAEDAPIRSASIEAGGGSSALSSELGVVEFIDHMISDAYLRRASDIHVEPNGKERPTLVRLRIDGECETAWRIPPQHRAQLIARLKIMANLNIAEHRKPQDGKIDFKVGKNKVELRVACIPTVLGDEDLVLRILAAGEPLPLEQMGFSPANLEAVKRIVASPHGLVLVVGPTGSGKTTTLHSLLKYLNNDKTKIITAEDPVEIVQPGLRQVQMHSAIGLDFAAALRAFLRSDPDVIMVGEMRDLETATIGVESSLTGHLVLSTLHTNSAPETITRLVDLGLDPFMFADALLGVLAQRLVRRLCEQCKYPEEVTQEQADHIIHVLGVDAWDRLRAQGPVQLWRVKGCTQCQGKGYRGRLAVHELLVSNEAMRAAIQHKATVAQIRDLARQNGMATLAEDGLLKALSGYTDLEQVEGVCGV